MDPRRLFGDHPPRSDMETLLQLVEDWQWRFGENGPGAHHRDEVVQFAKDAPSFRVAVRRAVDSIRPNGKMHNHQSRIPKVVKRDFTYAILAKSHYIRETLSFTHEVEQYTRFDVLYDLIKEIAPPGIGPVTVYDVATRIAAWMGFEEQQLYMHAGVRLGWRTLYPKEPYLWLYRLSHMERVPRNMLPKSLQLIPTSEVEDFLCSYRILFSNLKERV